MQELLGSAWIEINLDSVKRNAENIRELVGSKIKIMGVVKGNGYGHDAVEVSRILLECGVDQLAVARIEEAIRLRENGINVPILVLGLTMTEQMKLYIEYQVMPTISDIESVKKLNKIGAEENKVIKIHIKVETGMGRIGIKQKDVIDILKKIMKMQYVNVDGIFTHFSTADELNKEYTYKQFECYKKIMDKIKDTNIAEPVFHVANSSAVLDLHNMWLDMIRPGSLIYGLYPSEEVKKIIKLYPALTFKSRISFIKKLDTGMYIGYGNTFKTKRETVVGTISAGYADGYSRLLSNCGKVLIRGEKVPVIGRVCMDQMMVDLTDLPEAGIGDEVLLWGEQSQGKISIEAIAKKLDTISEEIVHLTDKTRVAKLFIKNGKPWKIKNMLGEKILNEL